MKLIFVEIPQANDDTHLFLRRIIAVFAVLLQLFFWCWYGNNMSTVVSFISINNKNNLSKLIILQ